MLLMSAKSHVLIINVWAKAWVRVRLCRSNNKVKLQSLEWNDHRLKRRYWSSSCSASCSGIRFENKYLAWSGKRWRGQPTLLWQGHDSTTWLFWKIDGAAGSRPKSPSSGRRAKWYLRYSRRQAKVLPSIWWMEFLIDAGIEPAISWFVVKRLAIGPADLLLMEEEHLLNSYMLVNASHCHKGGLRSRTTYTHKSLI